MKYRNLTTSETEMMTANGCWAADWSKISVTDRFDPSRYRNCRFSGEVKLGSATNTIYRKGIPFETGIYDATIHNCVIGENVYIKGIANYIANYIIEDNVFIQNVNKIECNPGATFGIGVEVSVLNETGGREVPIYEALSAHTAYLIAMYRHDTELIDKLRELIAEHARRSASDTGMIASGSVIVNTGSITDVNVGAAAIIDSATNLTNGTVASTVADPVFVGANVMAKDFILASGSHVEDGAVLLHTFIGQATHLSHLFSAHDSLFFANCSCENGEAAAIFAGPYTVTMHKSSLLIAGMFSFLNAGSGSNQSNHMYKLGPIHQGVVERGSKTTSDSYILWPARIGAFSLVMGRHVSHPDTSSLPFSYLIENSGVSHLVPGANIKSVGTIRDAQKWPKRDRRKDPDRLDFINFNLLSPYTVSKMMNAINVLDNIEQTSGPTSDIYSYQGMLIKASSLRKGREYYSMAIDKFMGNSVIKRLENCPSGDTDMIRKALEPTHPAGDGDWVDLSGLFAPKSEIDRLRDQIVTGRITDLGDINRRFACLAADYYEMEWTWVASMIDRWWGKPACEMTSEDIIAIVERWRHAVISLDRLLYNDAKKEFSLVARTSFGLDDRQASAEDFDHVRGCFDKDPFVTMVTDHIKQKTDLGNELITRMSKKVQGPACQEPRDHQAV